MDPDSQTEVIETVFQSRLKTIEKIIKFDVNFKKLVLIGYPGLYHMKQCFRSWQALSNDTLRSKIALVV